MMADAETARRRKALTTVVAFFAFMMGAAGAAQAQCALPYTLTNGQLADASQVMANFNALAKCLGAAGSTNAIQYNNSGSLGGVGPLNNGQLVIGSTGNAPQAQAFAAGPGIAITNGSGSITIATAGGEPGNGLFNRYISVTPTSSSTGLTTWLNQGTASVSDSAVGICINAPSSGTTPGVISRYMAAPSTPYTITALMAATRNSSSSNGVGIGWYDGSAKLHVISYSTVSGAPAVFQVNKFNSVSSFNGSDFTSNANQFPQPVWVQIRDDGTNVSFAFSQDGFFFLTVFSVAKSSGFLGATGYSNIVFFVNPQGSQTLGTVLSWTQS
jgi:hypothetical protein